MQEEYRQLMESYEFIKRKIKKADQYLYERWKAGGFLIDSDIVSMYPNLEQVMEQLDTEQDDEDDDDDEDTH